MYGGAAGGGKSDALLMAALQYVEEPGYVALLFRRTFPDLSLPGAIMDRANDWLRGTKARWNGQEHTWRFPSGAVLTFGYMNHEDDKYRYQGSAAHFVGFDELTQFTETQYRYLFSRQRRSAESRIPIRMRAASNPGGVGHEWVKQRFVTEGRAQGHWFIPASLRDNPHLDRADYERSLAELDPTTRAQLLRGDWDALPAGSKFRREWFEVVDEAPADAARLRYWDLAATEPRPGTDPDWTAGALLATKAGRYWLLDMRRIRATPQGVEQLVRQTAELDGRGVPVWMEQEPGSSGVNTIDHYGRRVLQGFTFRGNKTTGDKALRANPLSSAAQAGNVLLVRGAWVTAFLDEAEAFPAAGVHDDQVDAASGALAMLTAGNADAFLEYNRRLLAASAKGR